MRVRCSFCGAGYEAAVGPEALALVDRCDACGRAGLEPLEQDARTVANARRPAAPGAPTDRRARRGR